MRQYRNRIIRWAVALVCGGALTPLFSGCGGGSQAAPPAITTATTGTTGTILPSPPLIVFDSIRNTNTGTTGKDIYTMLTDGSGVTQRTRLTLDEFEPVFTAENKQIVYVSLPAAVAQLNIMNADGSNQTPLLYAQSGRDVDVGPDGTILYASDFDHKLYALHPNAEHQVRLTEGPGKDSMPRFSKDGSKITFVSEREISFDPAVPYQVSIYTMNADGTGVTRLTNSGALDIKPSFSPDGKHILFQSDRTRPGAAIAGNSQIYVMNTDGSNPTLVTNDNSDDTAPSYSPDGSKIVFCSTRNSPAEPPGELLKDIFVMNADGSNQTRLTQTGDNDNPRYTSK